MTEIWKSLSEAGFSRYEVSDQGNVRNDVGYMLKPQKSPSGYMRLTLISDEDRSKGQFVHSLVLQGFQGLKPGKEISVDHINRQRADNRLCNLRYATAQEQSQNRDISRPRKGIPVCQCDGEGNLIKIWDSAAEAGKALGVDPSGISKVCSDKNNKTIAGGYRWHFYVEEVSEEEWRPVQEERLMSYSVSSCGRIKGPRGRITRGSIEGSYYRFGLHRKDGSTKKVSVHRLVAEVFLGLDPSDKTIVINHKDGDGLNNNVNNLECTTQQQNVIHAIETGLKGCKPVRQYSLDGEFIKRYISIAQASRETGRRKDPISEVCRDLRVDCGKYYWRFDSAEAANNAETESELSKAKRELISKRKSGKEEVSSRYGMKPKSDKMNKSKAKSELGKAKQEQTEIPPSEDRVWYPLKKHGTIKVTSSGDVVTRINHSTKHFRISQYASEELAVSAAEKYLSDESMHAKTNHYCVCEDKVYINLTVDNLGEIFLIIDYDNLPLLETYIWRERHSRAFAMISRQRVYIEEILFPEQIILRYLDGNKLNNCLDNLVFEG